MFFLDSSAFVVGRSLFVFPVLSFSSVSSTPLRPALVALSSKEPFASFCVVARGLGCVFPHGLFAFFSHELLCQTQTPPSPPIFKFFSHNSDQIKVVAHIFPFFIIFFFGADLPQNE